MSHTVLMDAVGGVDEPEEVEYIVYAVYLQLQFETTRSVDVFHRAAEFSPVVIIWLFHPRGEKRNGGLQVAPSAGADEQQLSV